MSRKIAVVLAMLALSGCASGVAVQSIRDASDRAMERVVDIKARLAAVQEEFNLAFCWSFPAMKRYAAESDANQAEMERVCGVVFTKTKAVVK